MFDKFEGFFVSVDEGKGIVLWIHCQKLWQGKKQSSDNLNIMYTSTVTICTSVLAHLLILFFSNITGGAAKIWVPVYERWWCCRNKVLFVSSSVCLYVWRLTCRAKGQHEVQSKLGPCGFSVIQQSVATMRPSTQFTATHRCAWLCRTGKGQNTHIHIYVDSTWPTPFPLLVSADSSKDPVVSSFRASSFFFSSSSPSSAGQR